MRNEADQMQRLIHYSEILSWLYNWQKSYGPKSPIRADLITDGHNFNRLKIGMAKYNNLHAVISKSASRLEKRGLIKRYKNGLLLTELGSKALEKLGINVCLQENIATLLANKGK